MFADKIKITEEYIELIVRKRNEHNLTAYQLSEKIGKNKSWLPNIENRRTKNISKNDLLLIFNEFAKEENMDTENYIIKYISQNTLIELEDNISVPCHYLQSKLEIRPPKYIPPSLEEAKSRLEYYCQDKTYQVDLIAIKKQLDNLNELIIDEFSYLSPKDREKLTDTIIVMYENFLGHFKSTESIYGVSIFHGDPNFFGNETAKIFLNDISNIKKKYESSIKLAYSKASINVYFEESPHPLYSLFNDLTNLKKENQEELSGALYSIEFYIFQVFDYINNALNDAYINNYDCYIDYEKIYVAIKHILKNFVDIAELNYSFDFVIPNNSYTKEDIDKKQLELNNILFNIKQRFHKKYNRIV